MEWWHWTIGGIALTLLELLIPSFFVLWFGLGALLVAAVLWLWPALPFTAQLLLWIAASAAMVVLWFRVFQPSRFTQQLDAEREKIVGEIGLIVSPVDTGSRGQVRFQRPLMGAEVWQCVADTPIGIGERVRVCSVECVETHVVKVVHV